MFFCDSLSLSLWWFWVHMCIKATKTNQYNSNHTSCSDGLVNDHQRSILLTFQSTVLFLHFSLTRFVSPNPGSDPYSRLENSFFSATPKHRMCKPKQRQSADSPGLGDLVGYSIRLESKRSFRTKILVCTTGRAAEPPRLCVGEAKKLPTMFRSLAEKVRATSHVQKYVTGAELVPARVWFGLRELWHGLDRCFAPALGKWSSTTQCDPHYCGRMCLGANHPDVYEP